MDAVKSKSNKEDAVRAVINMKVERKKEKEDQKRDD